MMLFRCSWLKYRFIKIDLVTEKNFWSNFSRVLGGVNVNSSARARARLNHGLCDAQNVCALTKVGTALKYANPQLKFNLRLDCVSQSPINTNLIQIGGLNLIHIRRKIKSLIGQLILE